MAETSPILMWFRRDLRLSDHPALSAACATGRPVIPVFIHDDVVIGGGAAPAFRFAAALRRFAQSLTGAGSRLILRRGPAAKVLDDLIAETGAGAVYWSRAYDPDARSRDSAIKADLKARGIGARSFPGHLLFEPWTVATKAGSYFKVYTPLWNAVRSREVPVPLSVPGRIAPPSAWPDSDRLDDWHLGADMRRGAAVLAPHMCVGEVAAQDRLADFVAERIARYRDRRDLPGVQGTSGLSENLTYGEVSVGQCWHAGQRALAEGDGQAEVFLKELVWREFAYHLMYHTPGILTRNWKPGWDSFPWGEGADPAAVAWTQGRTGVPFVDAAMRQMYVTGAMHNRGRMIVASYLTKHLMTHWRVGQAWFADCLIDWDPASNAMGWQWAAGSGPDAAPYFRIFNPETQLARFDPEGHYARTWIAEGQGDPPATALSYFDAIPRSWRMSADAAYPAPVVELAAGRARALGAYEARDF